MNQPINQTSATTHSPPPGSRREHIPRQERINALLRDLEARRASISIRFGQDQEFFHGTLNRMDPSRGWLFLSELTPYQGNLRMAAGQQIHMYAVLNASCLHFRAEALHSGEHDGEAFHVVSMPTELDSEQKRAHFRAPVDDSPGTPVTLVDRDGRQFTGNLVDISLGGLRAMFPLKTPIHARDLLTLSKLAFSDIELVQCGIQIRFASDDKETGTRLVGGRFYDLSQSDEQALLRTLLFMERERVQQCEPEHRTFYPPGQ
ncbi:flagellar brake protein [Ectothiorhodospira shaposhnikovii]|uniref:flagellar brake protein n=1 Tax=Ectothiorhodospira shaposhnikovii TaxID=1054 RepID=UPI001EE8B508|nr:flagellar brake protein [Ectothiorhodospira shaposhnikovii]MCG5513581.1 flagellar brake protein [Ectothiorhodospira shaposhnikovii]